MELHYDKITKGLEFELKRKVEETQINLNNYDELQNKCNILEQKLHCLEEFSRTCDNTTQKCAAGVQASIPAETSEGSSNNENQPAYDELGKSIAQNDTIIELQGELFTCKETIDKISNEISDRDGTIKQLKVKVQK